MSLSLLQSLCKLLEACPTVCVVNVMHTPVDEVSKGAIAIKQIWKGPIGAYPNNVNSKSRFALSNSSVPLVPVDEFVSMAEEWRGIGLALVGGCCGMGPEYIQAIATHFSDIRCQGCSD